MDFSEYLYYSESSPSKLRWKVQIRSGYRGNRTMADVDELAGYLSEEGYWMVGLKGRYYPAHRIIWTICSGPIPPKMQVDHKNRVRSDNTFDNLRLATKTVNMQNCSKQCNNSTGKTGVSWMFNGANDTYAVAQWSLGKDGNRKMKYFSVRKHGLLPAFKLACDYRAMIINQLNEQGACYTETHGT